MLAICVLTILKLLVFPLVALLFGLALGLHGNLLLALILLCSTPTATHNYIIANQYDLPDQVNIQTFVVVFTTILSACTGPSVEISSARIEFIVLCLLRGDFIPLNLSDTTTTLKCVSEFLGLNLNVKGR